MIPTSLARPERFELPTTKFVAWYSIQLSYGRISKLLSSHPWQDKCDIYKLQPEHPCPVVRRAANVHWTFGRGSPD
jgi:hypothetical protein